MCGARDHVRQRASRRRPPASLAGRLKDVEIAASVAMTTKARELRGAGIKVISLAIGEPDFATPPHAIEAAHKAALAGDTKYPPQDGTPALKAAIQRKFKRDNDLDYALDEIMVANGGKQVHLQRLHGDARSGRRGGDPRARTGSPTPTWRRSPAASRCS